MKWPLVRLYCSNLGSGCVAQLAPYSDRKKTL